jgi:hypothetical protein
VLGTYFARKKVKNMGRNPEKNSRGAELEPSVALFRPLSAGQRQKKEVHLSFQPEISLFFTFFSNSTFFSKKT